MSQVLKELPAFEVAEVVLMLVGFLFEADVAVGFYAVAVLEEEDEPLDAVPDKEGQIEEFPLLSCVNEFMIEFHFVQRPVGKDKAK